MRPTGACVLLFVAALSLACSARTTVPVGPPPIPPVSGTLTVDVVYPRDSSRVSVRDSNFVFGSVGNGNASLSINGQDVDVAPNGAFLAWLPVPEAHRDTLADYELVATLDGREVRAVHTVKLSSLTVPLAPEPVSIDASSFTPRGAWWVRTGELVSLSVRATPGAQVRLLLPYGDTIPFFETPIEGARWSAVWIFGQIPTVRAIAAAATGVFVANFRARSPLGRGRLAPQLPPVPTGLFDVSPLCIPPPADSTVAPADSSIVPSGVGAEAGAAAPTVAGPEDRPAADTAAPVTVARDSQACGVLEVVLADDTARAPLPLDLWLLDTPGPVVELREEPFAAGSDGFVVGRAAPGSTTLWMWSEGVRARVSGRRNGWVRLELDGTTEAWVSLDEVKWLRGASLASRARVTTVRFTGQPDVLRAHISVSQPAAYQVKIDERRLTLALYGAFSDTDWLRYGSEDPFLRRAWWEQPTADRYLLHVDLAAQPWGYRVRHDGTALLLEIRKPPPIDPEQPLSGRTIMVDPGHPPAGATGPTRLYEGDANLAVAYKLKRLLEQEDATVILTRSDRRPVRLYDRTNRAEQLNAEILVSIHNNALPDGVNPFNNHGTSVYYFHNSSLDLARSIQRRMLETMGLADLGIGRASLALARPTWMPAVLAEGAFMMIPQQEAALRDPGFQEAYAKGVLEGLRDFFQERSE